MNSHNNIHHFDDEDDLASLGSKRNRRYNYQLLIELVKKNPAIFDNKHEMYRNRLYIQNIWQQIAKEMSCSDKICREKWANLRSNYMREMRKLKAKQTEGSNPPFKITWTYFNAMSFLNTYFKSNETAGINSPESPHEDEERLVIDLSHDQSQQTPGQMQQQSHLLQQRSAEQRCYGSTLHHNSSSSIRNVEISDDEHSRQLEIVHSPSVVTDETSNKSSSSIVSFNDTGGEDRCYLTMTNLYYERGNEILDDTTITPVEHVTTAPASADRKRLEEDTTITVKPQQQQQSQPQPQPQPQPLQRKRKHVGSGDAATDCSCSADKSYLEEMVQSLKTIAENSALSDASTSDSDKMFLLSLLPSMRRLSTDDNLALRLEMQQLLTKKLRITDKKMKRRQPEFRYASIRDYTAANGKVLKDFRRTIS